MIDNANKQKELLFVLKEISEELDKITEARDQIKEIINAASETYKLPKPLLRKVSRIYHNQTLMKVQNEMHEVKELYTDIVSPGKE